MISNRVTLALITAYIAGNAAWVVAVVQLLG